MTALWKKRPPRALRHPDPDEAIAEYLERLRQADLAGTPPPPSALNGIGDAYLDKEDVASAVDYYRQAAEAYAQAGLHDHAIACCRKIRRHQPADADAALLLARSTAAKGLKADAVGELESLVAELLRVGDRRRATEALRELVRLAPERADRREELARLLAAVGERDAAVGEYRAAAGAYVARGDEAGAARVRERLAELDAAPPPPASEAPSRQPPSREPAPGPAAPPPGRPLAPEAAPPGAAAAPLEIEHTSYMDQEAARASRPGPETPAAEPADGAVEDLSPRERAALAEAYFESGREAEAAGTLALAADGFRRERRWAEAADAYRRLAGMGAATAEHFTAWTECARQTGEARRVLESLSAASRWFLEREDPAGARRAAEEMLLIDPANATAGEILARLGPTLPLG